MKKRLVAFLLTIFTCFTVISQTPTSWSVESRSIEVNTYEVKIIAEIDEGWHLYSQYLESDEGPLSTYITFESPDLFEIIDKTSEVGVETHYDPVWEMDISFFSHSATFIQKVKALNPDSSIFKGNVNFMVCDDKECLPPDDYSFEIDLKKGTGGQQSVILRTDSNALAIIPMMTSQENRNEFLKHPVNSCGDYEDEDRSFWMLFIFGLIGGLISLLTPCVFPMVPLTVSFFTKGGSEKGSGIAKALLYGFSIIAVYASLSIPFYFQGTDPEILNKIASSAILNIIFFLIFMVFAFSFFGYYELTLPTSWANKADKAADLGGIIGVVFMALVLAIVSFSCTGPLLGSVLAGSLDKGPLPITMAMAGFGVGLGIPFTIFAAFPAMLKSMPQSGGWLNSVKVVLGFVEVALAFKFLSTADLVEHWGILKYELFLILWILCAAGTAVYLLGYIKFPHDSPIEKLKPTRIIIASAFGILAVYFCFGFKVNDKTGTYQALNLLSGVAPPVTYSWFHPNDCPNGLNCYHEFEAAQEDAIKNKKPILIDFTGHACTNCRRMEDNVWSKKDVFDIINEDYILASLYVDDRKKLSKKDQGEITIVLPDSTIKQKKIITVGDKWATFESLQFGKVSQPFYVLISPEGKLLTNPIGYTPDPIEYPKWLKCGLDPYEKSQSEN